MDELKKTIDELQAKIKELENFHKCEKCGSISKFLHYTRCQKLMPHFYIGGHAFSQQVDHAFCENYILYCDECKKNNGFYMCKNHNRNYNA